MRRLFWFQQICSYFLLDLARANATALTLVSLLVWDWQTLGIERVFHMSRHGARGSVQELAKNKWSISLMTKS